MFVCSDLSYLFLNKAYLQNSCFEFSCSFSPRIAPSSFTQTSIISSICPKTTQLFHASHTHAPVPTALAYRCTAMGVCSANLNHTGWAHLCKQMSTGATRLFLFRVESVRMARRHPSYSQPATDRSLSGPQQADLAPTSRREEPTAAGGRKHWCSNSSVDFSICPTWRRQEESVLKATRFQK